MDKIINSRYGLASLTNAEIYCLISDYLGCGGLGSHLIEEERLYISFFDSGHDYFSEISFVFLSTLPMISEDQKEPETYISLGKIDLEEDDIYITTRNVNSSFIDSRNDNLDFSMINKIFLKGKDGYKFYPFHFIETFTNLIDRIDFSTREKNELFNFYWDSPLSSKFKINVKLDNFDSFNGCYYLIAKPYSNEGIVTNELFNYLIKDNRNDDYMEVYKQEKIDSISEFINVVSYESYLAKKTTTPSISVRIK